MCMKITVIVIEGETSSLRGLSDIKGNAIPSLIMRGLAHGDSHSLPLVGQVKSDRRLITLIRRSHRQRSQNEWNIQQTSQVARLQLRQP